MAKSDAPQAGRGRWSLYPLDWLEERSGLVGGDQVLPLPQGARRHRLGHTLGSATLTAFLVQAITGVILAMYYKPSPDEAYASIQHITNDVDFGWLVRGMHRWGASVFIILLFFHMARVFLYGAYKYPRELNWIIGVILLILGMFEGFTGYLLPYDQTAYWATVVGMNINANGAVRRDVPGAVPARRPRDRGRHADPGSTRCTCSSRRALIFALIGLHLYLVIRLGVSSPPWSKEAAGAEPPSGGAAARRAPASSSPRPARRPSHDREAEREPRRRAARSFARYKEDVKKRGKPFFPYAMFHDTVMSLVVVVVIIALACVWKWTTPGDHTGTGAGWLGPLYSRPGRPGDDELRAAPRLVLLLPLLPAPDLQVAGLGDPRNGRDPDDHHGADDRAAVPRHAAGAATLPAPGRGRDLHPRP